MEKEGGGQAGRKKVQVINGRVRKQTAHTISVGLFTRQSEHSAKHAGDGLQRPCLAQLLRQTTL